MKELANKINADKHFKTEAYLYMKQQFDEETAKPFCKRDFKKIEQLTAAMSELYGDNDNSYGISKLYSRIEQENTRKKKSIRTIKKLFPIACCTVVMLVANCISVAAWDMNIFSAVIEFTKGGFSVDFGKDKQEIIELPVSEDDPYGIISECAKYDIFPETPHYLPDGFKLESVDSNVNENFANSVNFVYKNKNQSIQLSFDRYWNEVAKTGIPSDNYNISEITVNGKTAIVSKEDEQYTITFNNGKTVFFMFTQDVPYEECEKIVESIK